MAKRCALFVAFAVFCSTLTFAVTYSTSKSPPAKDPAVPAPVQAKHESVQTVNFAIYADGIYPATASVDKGVVVVSITDFTGGTQGLVVARDLGSSLQQLSQVTRFQNQTRGREEIRLTPGQYQVYDAGRPQNRATLTVTP